MEEPRGQPGGSEESRDCKDRKLILLQSGQKGVGVQSSGLLSPGAGWNHRDLPGNNWSQRSCAAAEREKCLPSSGLGKATYRDHTPLIPNRVGEGQEKAPRLTARICTAGTLRGYSHSAACGLSGTQHTSILQPKVKVSCSKISATGTYSDSTDVTLSITAFFINTPPWSNF